MSHCPAVRAPSIPEYKLSVDHGTRWTQEDGGRRQVPSLKFKFKLHVRKVRTVGSRNTLKYLRRGNTAESSMIMLNGGFAFLTSTNAARASSLLFRQACDTKSISCRPSGSDRSTDSEAESLQNYARRQRRPRRSQDVPNLPNEIPIARYRHSEARC